MGETRAPPSSTTCPQALPDSVTAARQPLELKALVRIQAGQPDHLEIPSRRSKNPNLPPAITPRAEVMPKYPHLDRTRDRPAVTTDHRTEQYIQNVTGHHPLPLNQRHEPVGAPPGGKVTRIKQHNQLIATQAAANEAERRVQDWMANHAGPKQAKAKKFLTTQGGYTTYDEDGLLIETATMGQNPLFRRCGVYSIDYQPQSVLTRYTAHALIIFPHEDMGSGAISLTVHQPDDWGNETPPWQDLWKDPTDAISDIINKITEQDHQQLRRRRTNRNDRSFENLQQAREIYGPVVFITPRGNHDAEFSTLVQEHRGSANMVIITEADQLNMSEDVPDNSLREWLSAKAVLIKDSYDIAPNDHPITIFDHPGGLKLILDSIRDNRAHNVQDMAQRAIIRTFMEILNEYQALQNVMDEAGKNNPGHLRNTAIQLLTQDIPNWQEETDAPPEKDPQDPDLEAQSSRAQQRISTLEDQLKEEQNKNEDMENQINELQTQVEAYKQYMEQDNSNHNSTQDQQEQEEQQTAQSREETVIEAITQPGRFPHLRFLNTTGRSLSDYGKARPRGEEIITALDTIDSLAELYLESNNGNVGSWKEYFNMPGWTYANSESDSTMGKYPKSRTFQDHEKNRQREVQRHLTYRGSNSGLQIFFDSDGEGKAFIIAYIGEHLPYVSKRT